MPKSNFLGSKIFLAISLLLLILGFGLLTAYYLTITQTLSNVPAPSYQDTTQLEDYLATIPKKELNETEIQGILYMREEEKLARDVYLELYDKWGSRIYLNIAHSEQTHMDAVLLLIERYNLDDPVVNDSRGAFTNPIFKDLFNKSIINGTKSLESAYRVGALIEEIDIIDLDKFIEKTDNEDIKIIYSFLRNGSYNHLRAYVKQLDSLGVTYTPVLLDQDRYNQIITSPTMGGGMGPSLPKIQTNVITVATIYFYGGIISIIAGIGFLVVYYNKKV